MAASPEQLRTAVDEYRRLFRPQQLNQLHACRRLALDAMCDLAAFEPQLAGSLVHGDGPLDRIRLLLRADTPEQVIMHLDDRHIPWRTTEASLLHAGERRIDWPALRFMAGDTRVELVILPRGSHGDPPRDPLANTRRLERLDRDQLQMLIDGRSDQRWSSGG